ncbi:MAG: uroporphyrinogen decarboxylase family protein [Lachnospiraceae bacterium]|nr:uroporphyrinogen decarboxylase family protein [Lachnospiraceae bacterium]MDY4969539.1 uroporphyrinogen decarboxylase family protein [Lachnospiraceae bacterium]
MSERTPKQNFLDMAKGICPDYIPMYSYGPNPFRTDVAPNGMIGPGFLNEKRTPQGGYDIWGVHYVVNRESGYSALPEPNHFILDDITKWRDVIKAPDISGIDWEKMARQDLENLKKMGIDREQTALGFSMHIGYFQELMGFMGFTEGLCAIFEEPEEVKALMEYMSDFYCQVAANCIDYYQPDFIQIVDDTAAWGSPFISPDQYRELFKPCHAKEAQFGLDRGLPIAMHDCGKCECFIDDWMDFGVNYWDPVQVCNNLDAVRAKYPDLVLCGAWDAVGPLASVNVSEEEFKQSIMDTMDHYGKDGKYVFAAWIFGDMETDEVVRNKNRWMTEVCMDYGKKFYRR